MNNEIFLGQKTYPTVLKFTTRLGLNSHVGCYKVIHF